MKEKILLGETFQGIQGDVDFIPLKQYTTCCANGVKPILSPTKKKPTISSKTKASIPYVFYYAPFTIKFNDFEKFILPEDCKGTKDRSIIFIPILLSDDTYRALIIMPAFGEQKAAQAYYYNPINNIKCEDAITKWVEEQYGKIEIISRITQCTNQEGKEGKDGKDGKDKVIDLAKTLAKSAAGEEGVKESETNGTVPLDTKTKRQLNFELQETVYLLAFIGVSIALLYLLNKVGKPHSLTPMVSSCMPKDRFGEVLEGLRLGNLLPEARTCMVR
ncbi:MAG: hypothetical protein K0R73_518 [Candidatus Midichloriaceae bacterium]|jgi:hypothetical protein|nr:hypothetical protein [Candidatus Midichloriaceae bacterium]